MMEQQQVLIEARQLKKHFPIRSGLIRRSVGAVRAIDGIDIALHKGETLGLVGESGCGKTTTGRCLLQLTPPTDGNVYYKMPVEVRQEMLKLEAEEVELVSKNPTEKKKLRPTIDRLEQIRDQYALNRKKGEAMRAIRREMQVVFQDPYSSLNPRMLIKDVIAEPLLVHGVARRGETLARVDALLKRVGLDSDHLYRYPHEFSGGQRQRIGVARALALNPGVVVLDEPTSALDVSVQAQILNMLNDLQSEFNLTYLFISHDLSTIRYMCDRIGVMYLGKVVEMASKQDLFSKPLHPYTEALLSAIPIPDPTMKRHPILLSGDVPSPAKPPPGCRFHTRCRYREAICEKVEPPLVDKGNGHMAACHFR
ncbi:MAG: ABC transporter ATP-binding protein [Methanomassiliicoccales archaeon]|nr:ABC transporter ATP-binding protein [Methanomassiliicoccales archaeon]